LPPYPREFEKVAERFAPRINALATFSGPLGESNLISVCISDIIMKYFSDFSISYRRGVERSQGFGHKAYPSGLRPNSIKLKLPIPLW
jgi:hypothetical protein